MTSGCAAEGCRAKIVDLLHSHARTRASGAWLIGQRGVIVGVLRHGTTALLELDGGEHDLPGGVRRWPVHWDDLLVYTVAAGPEQPVNPYRVGLPDVGWQAVQHAVLPPEHTSLCGKAVRPLPVCGWSILFAPTVARACPACARLAVTTAP